MLHDNLAGLKGDEIDRIDKITRGHSIVCMYLSTYSVLRAHLKLGTEHVLQSPSPGTRSLLVVPDQVATQ